MIKVERKETRFVRLRLLRNVQESCDNNTYGRILSLTTVSVPLLLGPEKEKILSPERGGLTEWG
jgi:hypothetical protein